MMRRVISAVALAVALAASYVDVRVSAAAALAVPAPPQLTASGESVTVTWAPVSGASGYRVQISLNGGPYLFAGLTDGATYSLVVDDLRSDSLPCRQGPCSVTAEVASTNDVAQSAFSAPSAAVELPMPYTISMRVARHTSARQVVLVLYGASSHAGQVLHLLKMSADRTWEDTGVTTTVHRQRVPGRRHRISAWLFRIVVRSRGFSNYRVEIPAAGPLGEGMSRPYGVRR